MARLLKAEPLEITDEDLTKNRGGKGPRIVRRRVILTDPNNKPIKKDLEEFFDTEYVNLITRAEPEMMMYDLTKLPKSALTGYGRFMIQKKHLERIKIVKNLFKFFFFNYISSYWNWFWAEQYYRTPIQYSELYNAKYFERGKKTTQRMQSIKGISKVLFRKADGIVVGKFVSDDPDNLRIYVNCWSKEIANEQWGKVKNSEHIDLNLIHIKKKKY